MTRLGGFLNTPTVMFNTVKKRVNLVDLISRDTGLIFKETGNTYSIEDDADTAGCPLPNCGHHDCFKIKYEEDKPERSFYHCFSCGGNGDAVKWVSERNNISQKDAVLLLAKEFNVSLPHGYTPVQEVFNLAANYYETCLVDSCNKPYSELGGLTPLQYQTDVRKHSAEVLSLHHVGWSDGGVIGYLQSLGFDSEVIEQSGLQAKKAGRDFLPSKCFIYPHFVNGRVSHFTFKDPQKRLAYQLPKKHSLNGYTFYGQDSVSDATTVIIVEGENDLISVAATGKVPAVIASIGQLSGEQLDWMRSNLASKNIVTMFDPDDAGNKYRVKVEKLRKFFKNMAHILPPEGKDIDQLLCEGHLIEDIVRNNSVKVEAIVESTKSKDADLPIEWGEASKDVPAPEVSSFHKTLESAGLATPGKDSTASNAEEDVLQSGNVIQKHGCYFRVTFKDGVPEYAQISDFIMNLKNVYLSEDGDRHREIVVVRDNGYSSDPFLIDSDTKVNEKPFRVLMAKVADGTFTGSGRDLAEVWRLVSRQVPDVMVRVPRTVGRMDRQKGFLFRNAFISDNGVVTTPDEDGIFWMHGHSIGLRPESLNQHSSSDNDRRDIPCIETGMSSEEADVVLAGMIRNLSLNLSSPGLALTALGWAKMCLYADTVFKLNKGVPQLFLWGTNGKGKTTIAKWVQDLYGMREHGSTSIPLLKTGVGWSRKSEYYSCLPLMIDEVRGNDETKQYLGTFRSYYDREGRTMGTQEGFGVRTTAIRSCFMFVGQDQFDDPATRERCIPIRIPASGRETVETYRWMEDNREKFTGVTYRWILEYCNTDLAELQTRIRSLDRELVAAGCPQRTSKNWAAIGVFGIQMAEKFLPSFDFRKYLIDACSVEVRYQSDETTLMQFWGLVESIMAKDNAPINSGQVMLDEDGYHLHIWYAYIYKTVTDDQRGRFDFSKNAVLSEIKDSQYFVRDDLRRQMGVDGGRPRVVTLDLRKAPEVLRNIARVLHNDSLSGLPS